MPPNEFVNYSNKFAFNQKIQNEFAWAMKGIEKSVGATLQNVRLNPRYFTPLTHARMQTYHLIVFLKINLNNLRKGFWGFGVLGFRV
jgi:hypothetical protein